MEETYLYQRIAEEIRREILAGRFKPGERLPSIRALKERWRCTPGTIQRAYHALAQQGLVTSQAGQGTRVSGQLPTPDRDARTPLRRVGLVNRAEGFLLEALSAGFTLDEVENALEAAKDRWRAAGRSQPDPHDPMVIRFAGSHDMAVTWLSGHIGQIVEGASLQLSFSGSLHGLMTLAEGGAELAGSHLLEVESGIYNEPYLRKLFPGQKMVAVRLAERRIGLITAAGNPLGLSALGDLSQPGLHFVNRQPGSGTRVWVDSQLKQVGVDGTAVAGYAHEAETHSEVARVIAEGWADCGVGLQSAASVFGLGFVPLVEEPYDLVTTAELAGQPILQALFAWLANPANRAQLTHLQGYNFARSGQVSRYEF